MDKLKPVHVSYDHLEHCSKVYFRARHFIIQWLKRNFLKTAFSLWICGAKEPTVNTTAICSKEEELGYECPYKKKMKSFLVAKKCIIFEFLFDFSLI